MWRLILLLGLLELVYCRSKPSSIRKAHHHKKFHITTEDPYIASTTTNINNGTTSISQDDIFPASTTGIPSAVTPSITTTEAITLRVGNKTINTNLKSALDDIAPGQGGKVLPASATYPPNVYNNYYMNNPTPAKNNKNSSNVIFEVIDVEPFLRGHHRYNARFLIVTSLYSVLGIACILTSYFVVKAVISKRKRHHQYMLLTKRDMEFPLGGGGI